MRYRWMFQPNWYWVPLCILSLSSWSGLCHAAGDTSVRSPDTLPKPKIVKTIRFKTGTNRISDLRSLERFANWLRVKSDVKDIRIEGFHCDADRTKDGVKPEEVLDYLLLIARERAETVRSALIARGMDGRKFEIVPLGISEDSKTCKVIAMAFETEKKVETAPAASQLAKPVLKVDTVSGKN